MTMSTKMEFEIEHHLAEGMEGILVEAIRKHPILYDKSDAYTKVPGFMNKCSEAWDKISDELSLEVESCRTLWTCTKQKFIKYRKRLDNGEPLIKEWPLYDTLRLWLDRHIKKRRSRNEIIKQIRTPSSNNQCGESDQQSNQIIPIPYNSEAEYEDSETIWDKIREKQMKHITRIEPKSQIYKTRKENPLVSIPKKKLKIEQLYDSEPDTCHENDTGIFTELEQSEVDEIQARSTRSNHDQIEIQHIEDKQPTSEVCRDVVLEANFDKLEQVIEKCVNLAEKCIAKNCTNQDATEVFGNYIAAMVRELTPEKRMKARFEIIQFTGELISRMNTKN